MNLNDIRRNAYLNQSSSNSKNEEQKNNIFTQNDFTSAFQKQNINEQKNVESNKILYKIPAEIPEPQPEKDSIYRRVAKFLVIIGEDEAAKIIPHLAQEQIEKIVPEIATINKVSPEESEKILAEFQGLLSKSRQSGGVETARDILEKAYGKDKAKEMLDKAMPYAEGTPFEFLNQADPERIYQLIKDESIGVQTLVLSYLDPKKAAGAINVMTDEEKRTVVLRLAKMEKVSPEVVKRVDKAMHEKSLKLTSEKAENLDGRNALAQILKKMSPQSENQILSVLSEENPDLGQDLRSRLFTTEDVVHADDRFIQEQLRQMEDHDVCYLIAGKTDEFRAKILSNVSQGRRQEIITQENILKPMRKADCERVTSLFFSVLRRAYDEGHLIIEGRNNDVYL